MRDRFWQPLVRERMAVLSIVLAVILGNGRVAVASLPAVPSSGQATSILIYSAYLTGEPSQVPYYINGQVTFLDKGIFEQYERGSQPWRGDVLGMAQVGLTNLLPQSMLEGSRKQQELIPGKKYVSQNGITIEVIDRSPTEPKVQMMIPGFASYDIVFESKKGILFVRSIVMWVSVDNPEAR